MAPILPAEDVVRGIGAECAYVDEHGGMRIRLEPAATTCGNMESSSGCRGVNDGHGCRSLRACSEFARQVAVISFATKTRLISLTQEKRSKLFKSGTGGPENYWLLLS